MALFYREYGNAQEGRPPLVFLHGLFGSSANWRGIARRFEDRYRVLVPDLRNHGQSPHHDDVSYAAQVLDVLDLFERLDVSTAILVGHSMGGKLAMHLALSEGARVAGLVCVDISPVRYPEDRFGPIFEGLAAVAPDTLESRRQADERLSEFQPIRAVRSYLLQNLLKESSGWRWRLNLSALEQGMPIISDFDVPADVSYLGQAVFAYGGSSPYVKPEHAERIRQLFPYARLRQIAGAGHWVYADQPDAFSNVLDRFLVAQES